MEVIEQDVENGAGVTVISLDIPIRIRFNGKAGKRENFEKTRLILMDSATKLFEIMQVLAGLPDREEAGEWLDLLGQIGKGVVEAMEVVGNEEARG